MANATTAKNFLVMKQNAKSEMTENETLWNQTRRVSSSRSDVKSMAGVQRPDDLLDNQGASCRVAGQWSTASRCSDSRRFSQIGLHRIVSHRPATLLRPIPCSRVVSGRVRSGQVGSGRWTPAFKTKKDISVHVKTPFVNSCTYRWLRHFIEAKNKRMKFQNANKQWEKVVK